MEGLEATSLLFGALVAILTLLSSVWYTAVAVNNRNRDIGYLMGEATGVKSRFEHLDSILDDNDQRLEHVEHCLEDVLNDIVKLVYINSDHILLEDKKGRVVKVPMVPRL